MKVSGLRSTRTAAAAGDGALLRLPIDEPHWAEQIPPVPSGFRVTVSFSSAAVADEHSEAIALLGYDVVGVHPSPVRAAMLLIDQELLEAHPTYWRSLCARSDAAYSLALGPVLALLDGVLQLHAAG